MNGLGQRATRHRDLLTWLVAGAMTITALAVTGTYWLANRHKEKPVALPQSVPVDIHQQLSGIPSPTRTVPGVSTPFTRRGQCRSNREERQSWRTCWSNCSAKRASAAILCVPHNANTTVRTATFSAPAQCTLSSILKRRIRRLRAQTAAGQSSWRLPRSLINTRSRW